MAEKFQNKYRIPSARLKNWDYRWAGAYFITICTHNRMHYFGNVRNGKMHLSNVGVLADVFWHEIKNHTDHVQLGEFVVMPNHIHGILIIPPTDTLQAPAQSPPVQPLHATAQIWDESAQKNPNNAQNPVQPLHATAQIWDESAQIWDESTQIWDESTQIWDESTQKKPNNSQNPVQPLHATALQTPTKNEQMAHISPLPGSISTIIRSYKSAVTKHARRLGYEFAWQTRFYDNIIRDERAFDTISNYIINNPMKWGNDKFHGNNI